MVSNRIPQSRIPCSCTHQDATLMILRDAGIWTKHLKAKTELHQTVIDRCLKSLVQKQLIKATKSVKVRAYTPCSSHLGHACSTC